jgi:ribosomal protein L37E
MTGFAPLPTSIFADWVERSYTKWLDINEPLANVPTIKIANGKPAYRCYLCGKGNFHTPHDVCLGCLEIESSKKISTPAWWSKKPDRNRHMEILLLLNRFDLPTEIMEKICMKSLTAFGYDSECLELFCAGNALHMRADMASLARYRNPYPQRPYHLRFIQTDTNDLGDPINTISVDMEIGRKLSIERASMRILDNGGKGWGRSKQHKLTKKHICDTYNLEVCHGENITNGRTYATWQSIHANLNPPPFAMIVAFPTSNMRDIKHHEGTWRISFKGESVRKVKRTAAWLRING